MDQYQWKLRVNKFAEEQHPRVPAGSPEGGQWTASRRWHEMTINEMGENLNRILAEFESKFQAIQIVDEDTANEVNNDIQSVRRRIAAVNPEMVLTSRNELSSVKRQMVQMSADAVYAAGGESDEAEAAKREMESRLFDS